MGLAGVALALLAVLYFLSYKNIYAKQLLFVLSVVVWVLFLKSGIHPTIAGVLLAFAVPNRKKMKMGNYVERLCELSDTFEEIKQDKGPLLTGKQIEVIDTLEDWTDQVQSPLQQLEHRLHNWVAFLIMPVFALSNSGVPLFTGEGGDGTLSGVIALSLVGGKFLGVLFFAWLAVKLRISDLPAGVRFSQIMGVALLAGVGFTMSIFVANLAFATHPELLDSAKTGILAASFGAGLLGYLVLRFTSTATE
ncbi:MAG: Na+/H+ antiporter NhaA [Bacteroidales bacterium]